MYSSKGGGAPSPRVSQVPTLSVGTARDSGETAGTVGGTVKVRLGSSTGRPDAAPASTSGGLAGSAGRSCLSNSFSVGILALNGGDPVGDFFFSLLQVYGREQAS